MRWLVVVVAACAANTPRPAPVPIAVAPKPAAPVAPTEPATLSLPDKLHGLAMFWKEASDNFAFFDQVPDLDWNQAHREAIARVAATTDDLAYYRELQRFSARLDDGHTNVFLPLMIAGMFDSPAIKLEEIAGQPVVTNTSVALTEQVPIGSVVTEVDGRSVAELLEREVMPLISADPPVRRGMAIRGMRGPVQIGLLIGRRDTRMTLALATPDGATRTVTVMRDATTAPSPWVHAIDEATFELTWPVDGIALVTIRSFMDASVADQFVAKRAELRRARGIILDVRTNGGGDGSLAVRIVNELTAKPFHSSTWKTRQHIAAYKAWGKAGNLLYAAYAADAAWFEGGSDRMTPPPGPKITAPVVVLVGRGTASAAEDLLVMLDSIQRAELVGEPSLGSTGQPLMFLLPGGAIARVCTKRDGFADGRELVGYGVQPHVRIERTLASVRAHDDVVLARGLEVLQARIAAGPRATPIPKTPDPKR
ncbi:MAG: S41 family peptidase [Kofleriaceae bacterium]